MFSSEKTDYGTPQHIFDQLNSKFNFTLDAAATSENAKCSMFFSPETDALTKAWTGNVFLNPPYGRQMKKWIKKAYEESQTNADVVVCLLPARTDTSWFHEYCMKGEIIFIKGRITFAGATNPAPYPSIVVVFKK